MLVAPRYPIPVGPQVAMLQRNITPTKAKASLVFFFAYEGIFATGWLTVPWLYPSEFMPLRHRTQSAAIATAFDWIFNLMTVQITPISISNIRWKIYMIFFAINIASGVVIWLFPPKHPAERSRRSTSYTPATTTASLSSDQMARHCQASEVR